MEIPKSKRLITLPDIYWQEVDKKKDNVLVCSHNQALISVLNQIYPNLIQQLQQDTPQKPYQSDIKPGDVNVIRTPKEREPKVTKPLKEIEPTGKSTLYTPHRFEANVCSCTHIDKRHEGKTGKCTAPNCTCNEFDFSQEQTNTIQKQHDDAMKSRVK